MDLLIHVFRYWRSICLLILLMGLAGWFGTALLQSEWEAVTVVKPGFGLGEQVETAAEVVDRVRGPEFLRLVMAQAGAEEQLALVRDLRNMKVMVTGDDSVRINVRDNNPERARLFAEKVAQLVQRQHAEMIQTRLAEFEEAVARYRKQVAGHVISNANSGTASRLSVDENAAKMEASYKVLAELEVKTLPPKTVATTISQRASVWPTPVWPNRFLFCALFCTIGAIIGFGRALAGFKG